jgi:ribosome-associated heat shock protein Hsp15
VVNRLSYNSSLAMLHAQAVAAPTLVTLMNEPETDKVRLDKWLWATRFFKTRGLASEAVSGGKVHCGGARVKPARQVSAGDVLEIRKGPYEFTVVVERAIEKRVAAPEARKAYTETDASLEAREALQQRLRDDRMASQGERLAGRPNKRDRRLLQQVKQRNSE